MTEVTTLSQLEKAEVKNDVKKAAAVEPPPPLKSSVKFTAPVIKKDEEVADNEEIKSQEELMTAKGSISIADVKGNDDINGKDIADIKENVTQDVEEKPYTIIEQMPVYPGGEGELLAYIAKTIKYPVIAQENGIEGKVIIRFVVSKTGKISNVEVLRVYPGGEGELLAYIAKTIKYPVIAQENGIEGKVIIRFVVSKTGKISNVEVLRSLDGACDREAVRVVKTLKDWIPGKQNGVNVPVYYTLPITFKLQQ